MLHAAKSIYREQGVSGFYRGLGVTLVEIMPYAALQFGLYDVFNQLWSEARVSYRHQWAVHTVTANIGGCQCVLLSSKQHAMMCDCKALGATICVLYVGVSVMLCRFNIASGLGFRVPLLIVK